MQSNAGCWRRRLAVLVIGGAGWLQPAVGRWCQGHNIVATIEEEQDQATEWLWTYNNERPIMTIGGMTPALKLKTAA